MSEYQYYEFLALDRPLSARETEELRTVSSRANITPVSFSNHYNYGDLRGDSSKILELYFDVFVYVANFMSAILGIRLPLDALSEDLAKRMSTEETLEIRKTKTCWIIEWHLSESEDYERFGMDSGEGWMARLSPIRAELLDGDYRSLYIGWLAEAQYDLFDALIETEPVFLHGLGQLTAAQQSLAEFIEVDPDVLAAAGVGSPGREEETTSAEDVDSWIADLPRRTVNGLLRQLLDGNGKQVERKLKSEFSEWRRSRQGTPTPYRPRPLRKLAENIEIARNQRLEQEKEQKKREEARHRRKRNDYLMELATRFNKEWKYVQKTVERGSGASYDEACQALVDLSDAYALQNNKRRFKQLFNKFIEANPRRKALIQRLKSAGLLR